MCLTIGLLATLLTAGLVLGLTLVSSNHLTGTSLVRLTLILTANITDPSYIGDTFHLVVTLTALSDRLVTFYNNGVTIGAIQSSGHVASIDFFVISASWDIYATAEY
jgi:hypothetical protein